MEWSLFKTTKQERLREDEAYDTYVPYNYTFDGGGMSY